MILWGKWDVRPPIYGGNGTKPFNILPKLRNFPQDLSPLANWTFFTSSASGWDNGKLFIAFCIYFWNYVSHYKVANGINEPVWLILDGHKTRANSKAVEFCAAHGVNLVILPAHTSHVTQPFDVGLAAPMKSRIRQLVYKPPLTIEDFVRVADSTAAKTRIKIVAAIVNAW